jgi:hypothetical protein
MSCQKRSQAFWGVFLIGLGLVMLLSGQPFVPVFHVGRLWPVILIVLGIGRFTAPRPDGTHWNGLWLVFIGTIFLLNNYNVVSIRDSWPLFVVAGGLSLVFGRRRSVPTRLEGPRQ